MENTSLLKLNTKKLNEQLINTEHHPGFPLVEEIGGSLHCTKNWLVTPMSSNSPPSPIPTHSVLPKNINFVIFRYFFAILPKLSLMSIPFRKPCHQYKLTQYSRQERIKIEGIPENTKIKNLEDIIIKMFEKVGISINKHMIVACHRLNKTKTIVKFANRKDPDLVLKSKKKLKGIKFLGFCSNTDED